MRGTVEIGDAKPHPESVRAAQGEADQRGQRERSDDRGQDRSAIPHPLAQVLDTDEQCVSHARSIAKRAAGYPHEDILEIGLSHADTLGNYAGVR